jgi:hypothetical protein
MMPFLRYLADMLNEPISDLSREPIDHVVSSARSPGPWGHPIRHDLPPAAGHNGRRFEACLEGVVIPEDAPGMTESVRYTGDGQ